MKKSESSFFDSEVREWMDKSQAEDGDGYLTSFATPSSKRARGRWRWKERRKLGG